MRVWTVFQNSLVACFLLLVWFIVGQPLSVAQPVSETTAQPAAEAPAANHPSAAAPVQASPVTPIAPKAPSLDLTIPLGIISALQLGGMGYLAYQSKKLKQDLEAERQRHAMLNQQLEYQALYDSLTQLPNRRLFRDRLLQTIKAYSRSKTCFGVLMSDLDHFKEINDTLGHDAGDMLLVEVTNRLRKAIRDSDTLARLGGDEFALICPSVQNLSSASVICMRMIDAMREPIMIKGKSHNIGISLGVALFPEHASDDEMLIRRADMAMYRAKQKRNAFVMYDPNIDRPKQNV